MEERINQALDQLEKDLQEITSARNQVESTVKASTALQKVVGEYVLSVKTFCDSLKSWVADLRVRNSDIFNEYKEAIVKVNTTCAEIIESFKTDVEKTSTDFKNNTKSLVEQFTEQNNILSEHVQDLNILKEEILKATAEVQSIKGFLTQLSKDLKESQESQDIVLGYIKQKTDAIPGIISEKADSIVGKLNSLYDKTVGIDSLLSRVFSLGQEVKAVSEQIHSTIQSSTNSLHTAIESSKNDTSKSININRWITIGGIIILIILHFI